jgi:hypothetical protein
VPDEAALAALAALLGVPSLDQHLYELPLVARKRLSWLWPLSGALPWIMLDEPTIGQDRAMRAALAVRSTASPRSGTAWCSSRMTMRLRDGGAPHGAASGSRDRRELTGMRAPLFL